MGNAMDIETAGRNEEIMKARTTELKKQMSIVDHSMIGLAKSIDSMQAACKMLVLHLEKKESDNQEDGNKEGSLSGFDLALELLRSIDEGVTDHKFIAMEVVCKMMHFIESTLHKYEVTTNEESDTELAMEKYFTSNCSFDKHDAVTYYDEKVKALRLEIGHLKEIKRSLHNRIDIMQNTEDDLIKEKKCLQEQIEHLEMKSNVTKWEKQIGPSSCNANNRSGEDEHYTETNNMQYKEKTDEQKTDGFNDMLKEHLKKNVKELADVKKCFELEKKKLEEEITKWKNEKMLVEEENRKLLDKLERKQTSTVVQVQVQIYRKYSRTTIENSFAEMLKSKAKKKSLVLSIIKCATLESIRRDKPVLILCETNSVSTISRQTNDTVDGVEATQNAAVVVFHTSNIGKIHSKQAPVLKSYHPYILFGGIFDVACDYYRGMHSCADNDSAADDILNFIYKQTAGEPEEEIQHKEDFLQR